MPQDNIFVCDKVENMTIENAHTFNCFKCNELIGMTKASYERYLTIKNIKPICHECFLDSDYDEIKVKTPSKMQMEELKKYIPDLTQEKMKKTLSKIEMIKNARQKH